MNSIEIKTQDDLDRHLKWHDDEVEKFSDAKQKILDSCGDTLTQNEIDSLDYLNRLQDNIRTDSYDLELENDGKITMYVNHEGSCMSNIQYCPWCGVHFILPQQNNENVEVKS